MRNCWRYLGLVFGVGVIFLATPTAAMAETLSISSTVTVSGIVPPRVILIVDASGNINKIFSNSSQDGEPMAMIGGIEGGQPTPMTDTLTAQYAAIKPSLNFKYGYIYTKPVTQTVPKPTSLKKSKPIGWTGTITSNIEFAASRLLANH